jgi:FkbM family methyltransferase
MNNTISKKLAQRIRYNSGSRYQRIVEDPIRFTSLRLFVRLARLLRRSFTIPVRTFWGADMSVALPECVSTQIALTGITEESLTTMVVMCVKPGMTFLDVGAHFGYYSLLASALVETWGHVHSFEPTPSTFSLLCKNVGRISNVSVNNVAVSNEEKTVTFNDYGLVYSAFNSIYSARVKPEYADSIRSKQIQVETLTLDQYVNDNKLAPDFVKIDAESAEYEILKGMQITIAQYHPMISVEVGDGVDGVMKSKDLILFIQGLGYKAYELRNGELAEHVVKDKYEYDNILFMTK